MKAYWFKFTRNKLSLLGLAIVLASLFFAVFAPVVVPFPAHIREFVDYSQASRAPSAAHWFGTDIFGRDVFSRVIYSFRGALKMSAIVLAIAVPVGVFLGLLAGYYSGTWVDTVIMRVTDIFVSLPSMVMALAIAAVLEPTLTNAMIALTVTWWPWYTRPVYNLANAVKKEYFVKSAELIGASKAHILLREILPSCLSTIMTKMALDVGWVILNGAMLSFVGLGEQPPIPAFGQMISDGAKYMPNQWWLTTFPALGIAFVILGFNLLGDGIRDMFDRGR